MAISKKIVLTNGVTTNYHRISCISNVINVATIIEVTSYTSEEKREEEKIALNSGDPMDVFMETKYKNLPYDAEMDVVKAYNYLKTLDGFKDSKDV